MRRRAAALAVAVLLAAGVCSQHVLAHAGPRLADPLEGATLGDTPTNVRLSFSEKPEASLSVIRVLDTAGNAYQIGQATAIDGDPRGLAVRVRPLARGVYIVSWRVVSAIDGHVTTGMYAFGVLTPPAGGFTTSATYAPSSLSELLARWMFIAGVAILLGATSAALADFDSASDLPLAVVGWLLAITGALLMADAQRRSAAASFTVLLNTSLGRTLIGRPAAIVATGAALAAARWATRSARADLRRSALAIGAAATLCAIAVHVGGGHAAAGNSRLMPAVVAVQWAHFCAAGVWVGGLAALLLGVRGRTSDRKAASVRRFSNVAAASLLVVVVTGIARTAGELASPADLLSTQYGRVVLAKIALIVAIAALAAVNRRYSVPAAGRNLAPLRRIGSGELVVAAGALGAAAILATLPPPAAAQAAPGGLRATGTDFATSVRAHLTAVSDQPGPNRFAVSISDYDSRRPINARRVSLRFTPLDDPGVAPTLLQLAKGSDDSYQGSGSNLAFDGRWQVTVLIERGADSVGVPLDIETRPVGRPFVFAARSQNQPPTYTVDVSGGALRISPDPEREGLSTLHVTSYDQIGDYRFLDPVVVTIATDGEAHQAPVRTVGRGRFDAAIELKRGRNTISVIARTADGTRLRNVFDVDVRR